MGSGLFVLSRLAEGHLRFEVFGVFRIATGLLPPEP